MSIFKPIGPTRTIEVKEGNSVEAYFDFHSHYNEIPAGVWEVECSDYCDTIWFRGPGHGALGDYGNGRLAVSTTSAPGWLIKHLGIKRNRRISERRKP